MAALMPGVAVGLGGQGAATGILELAEVLFCVLDGLEGRSASFTTRYRRDPN